MLPGTSASLGSEKRVTFLPKTFSPRRDPPPFFVAKLRPSSAERWSNSSIMMLSKIGDGGGLEDDSIFAGRQPDGLAGNGWPCRSPSTPMPATSSLLKSRCVVPAQPEPVPSGVRAVTVCSTSVSRVVDEEALAVGEAGECRADIEEAGGLQILRLAPAAARAGSRAASMVGRGRLRGGGERGARSMYFCGPIGGMNSGFSGASFAVFSEAATSAASASSLRSVPDGRARSLAEMRLDADVDASSARRWSSPCFGRSGRAVLPNRRW